MKKMTKFSMLATAVALAVIRVAAASDITVDGAINYIPKFTDPNTISNSVMYEDSGNIGIGTTSPHEKLTVAYPGNIKLQEGRPFGSNSSTSIGISDGAKIEFEHRSNGDDPLHFHARRMTIDEAGDVGIGFVEPEGKLSVIGKVNVGVNASGPSPAQIAGLGVHIMGELGIESDEPATWLDEGFSQLYRPDYGFWRIIANHNALSFQVWENPSGSDGNEFDITDEFLAFHRFATDNSNIGDHIIQWNYGFYGTGFREMDFAANWRNITNPQTPRVLSFVSLDESSNQLVNAMQVIPNGSNPYLVFPNGNVGFGVSDPGNILTVAQGSSTDPIADAWTVYSSKRWKTNIKPIENPLEKILCLNGVTFDWKKDGKHDIGLIAEEVGQVIPEIVRYEENGNDAESVDYARLVAYLIEAVKKQQEQIEQLKLELQL